MLSDITKRDALKHDDEEVRLKLASLVDDDLPDSLTWDKIGDRGENFIETPEGWIEFKRFRINSVFSLHSSNKPSSKHQRHQKTINAAINPPQTPKQQPKHREKPVKTRRKHPNKSPNTPYPPPPRRDPWLTLRNSTQRPQL